MEPAEQQEHLLPGTLLMVRRRGLLLLRMEQKDLKMLPQLLQHLQHNRTGKVSAPLGQAMGLRRIKVNL